MASAETFPSCITIPGNSRKVETQTLEMCPSWPRLHVQGEAKTQFLATNSAETMDVSPTVQTLAAVSTLYLVPTRTSDSAWCLSQPVFFPCGLCAPSDTRGAEVLPVLLSEGLNTHNRASSYHLEKALPVGAGNGNALCQGLVSSALLQIHKLGLFKSPEFILNLSAY